MARFSDNRRGDTDIVSSDGADYSVGGSSAQFFDRERWHDVETSGDDDSLDELSSGSTLSSVSVAILLLVSVVAAGGGLGFAYYIHQAAQWASQPILKDVDYRSIPQQWIGYVVDAAARFREVETPGCFAASLQGDVFIGEGDQPVLRRYSLQGALLATLSLDAVPTAVAVGEDDTLFPGQLVVAFRNRLAVYSMSGEKQTDWSPLRENGNIQSLALTSDSIYAADSTELVVLRVDETGKAVQEIGRKPKTPPKDGDDVNIFPGFVVFTSPISLTVSKATGMLFVANPGMHRIEVFTLDGHWEPSLSWGEASSDLGSFTGCCNPVSLASLSDGRIVTAEKSSNLRVKVFQTNRKLDWIVAGPHVLTKPPPSIPLPPNFRTVAANDEDRFVLVAAISGDRIVVYDPLLRIVRLFLPIYQHRRETNNARPDSP